VWVFFRSFPTSSHRGMSNITEKANAGSKLLHFSTSPLQA
jgi:hypothetical protein